MIIIMTDISLFKLSKSVEKWNKYSKKELWWSRNSNLLLVYNFFINGSFDAVFDIYLSANIMLMTKILENIEIIQNNGLF